VIIDPQLIDRLEALGSSPWHGPVHRHYLATRDPLAPSQAGGRWAPPGAFSILHTALDREGAIAEWRHLVARYTIPPSTPRRLATIEVTLSRVVDLAAPGQLETFGVETPRYADDRGRCPEIGAAADFLGLQGLLAPGARHAGANLMILADRLDPDCRLELVATEALPPPPG
jgi:RES domain-containing protein